ncbi:hypothetical protein [Kibdelosporangium philippinense]|uniref:hypothetical protein n=1 Tax=Kibdelosporangium philippinense TaxID=211113 RepID=UPI0036074075
MLLLKFLGCLSSSGSARVLGGRGGEAGRVAGRGGLQAERRAERVGEELRKRCRVEGIE